MDQYPTSIAILLVASGPVHIIMCFIPKNYQVADSEPSVGIHVQGRVAGSDESIKSTDRVTLVSRLLRQYQSR